MGITDVFLLGVETGILYPHKSLLGQKRNFHLIIEARDGGGNGQLFDRAVINVQVLNVNEHRPDFIIPFLPNATVEITEVVAKIYGVSCSLAVKKISKTIKYCNKTIYSNNNYFHKL